jgi:hypothetical protein
MFCSNVWLRGVASGNITGHRHRSEAVNRCIHRACSVCAFGSKKKGSWNVGLGGAVKLAGGILTLSVVFVAMKIVQLLASPDQIYNYTEGVWFRNVVLLE